MDAIVAIETSDQIRKVPMSDRQSRIEKESGPAATKKEEKREWGFGDQFVVREDVVRIDGWTESMSEFRCRGMREERGLILGLN